MQSFPIDTLPPLCFPRHWKDFSLARQLLDPMISLDRAEVPESTSMTSLTPLQDLELVPVLELEPYQFATRDHPRPSGAARDLPENLERYWLDALADAGITGLSPLSPGSWHVPTRDLTDPAVLQKMIAVLLHGWGGVENLDDPDGRHVLDGGLALLSGNEVLVEPTCCSDLGNVSEWRGASGYRGPDWTMLWIGHPWLSVRFDEELLILSDPHESLEPVGRWAVRSEELVRAVIAAEVELEHFAGRLARVLEVLGLGHRSEVLSRGLAGLAR